MSGMVEHGACSLKGEEYVLFHHHKRMNKLQIVLVRKMKID